MDLSIFTYSLIAAGTCGLVAIVELLYRYPHSTKPSAILWNWPAVIYLAINFAIGVLAVLAGASTGILHFNAAPSLSDPSGIFKALASGAAGLGLLRSSVATFKSNENETNVGFVEILDKIREMLDRKIELAHKLVVDTAISEIMRNVDIEKARYELPELCLAGINSCTEQDVIDMRAVVNKIYASEAVQVRHLLLGHALHEFCGLEVLRSAVKQTANLSRAPSDKVDDFSEELSAQLKRLQETGK